MKTLEELQELAIKMNYTLEELMYEMLCDSVDDLDKLQTRIDKAIEYLKSISMDKTPDYIPLKDYKEYHILLEILRGDE